MASLTARLPRPLVTLTNDDTLLPALERIVNEETVSAFVVGLPRNLQGDRTEQTAFSETFGNQLQKFFSLPVYYQDEALTSRQAEAELRERGVDYQRGDIDALAATYILDDFLKSAEGTN